MHEYGYAASAEREAKKVPGGGFVVRAPCLEYSSEALVHVAERLARAGRLAVLVDGGLAMSVAEVSKCDH